MNREEALELLNQIRPVDQWRRHETHSGYDPTHQATTTPAYPRFNHVGQQMSFPPVSLINVVKQHSTVLSERSFCSLNNILRLLFFLYNKFLSVIFH